MHSLTRRRLAPMALLTAALAVSFPASADWFGGVFGGDKDSRSGDRTEIAEREQIDFIRLVSAEAGATNAHPVRLSPAQIRLALAALRWVEQGRKPIPLFAEDEAEFLAAGLAEGLARATPQEDIAFLTTGKHAGGFVIPRVGSSGRAFFADGKLHLLISEAHVNYIGEARGAAIKHKFSHGSRNTASAVALELPREAGTLASRRADWAMFSLSQTPPEVESSSGAPVHGDAFFEQQATRLRGLKKLRDDGLINEEEYQVKRRKVLDGL